MFNNLCFFKLEPLLYKTMDYNKLHFYNRLKLIFYGCTVQQTDVSKKIIL